MEFYNEDYLNFIPKKKSVFKKSLKKPQTQISRRAIFVPFCIASILLCAAYLCFHISALNLSKTRNVKNLTLTEKESLEKKLDELYSERTQNLHNLPYKTEGNLFINAKSAILIDFETGDILFEKNADEEIPPASMTKLVEMYVVFEEIQKGKISLDDVVPLPKESWAVNLPSDASIMFLAEGQIVTLRELLLGLSIASGNDASIAVANYVAGSMDAFVEKMNAAIKELGLSKTHFVESSGYSEKNITTAREFASFCREYIKKYPFAISEFHSQKVLKYPLEKNLPEYKRGNGDAESVIQYNTNKLLGKLEGLDGLKTGFIYESGYNIALTAKRDSRRFISVSMGGPGVGSQQGNFYRNQDGTSLLEYAFANFTDYLCTDEKAFSVNTGASKQKAVNLIPAYSENFSSPILKGKTPEESLEAIEVHAEIPEFLLGDIKQAYPYGALVYSINGTVLNKIPLVADRSSTSKSKFSKLIFKLLYSYKNCFSQE